MKIIKLFFVLMFYSLLQLVSEAQASSFAIAVMVRGECQVIRDKSGVSKLMPDQDLFKGDQIVTSDKSVARILFQDKSVVMVGPSSSLVLTELEKGKTQVLTLVQGMVRTQVQKDWAVKKNDPNKLIISTKTAALGVRGTDFQTIVSKSGDKTNVITFSGEVALVQKKSNESASLRALLQSRDAVSIREGQFAMTTDSKIGRATKPLKLNPAQFNSLKQNQNLTLQNSRDSMIKQFNSIVPKGIDSKLVLSSKTGLEKLVRVPSTDDFSKKQIVQPEEEQSLAGGYVDLKTGAYIPPPPGSVFDPNSGLFVPPPSYGGFDPTTGEYRPPAGFVLNDKGEFVDEVASTDKKRVNPPPVVWSGGRYFNEAMIFGDKYPADDRSNWMISGGFDFDDFQKDLLREFANQDQNNLPKRSKINLNFQF